MFFSILSLLGEWLNNNQGILTAFIFVLTILIAWVAGIFKWQKSQASKRERASKIICVWSLFPDSEDENFFIFKFAPRFQNKTDEVIRDFWINFSSSGFNLTVNETPQMSLFEGWNHRGDALHLISKEGYRFAPQNFVEPIEIIIKLNKKLPQHGAWLYISYGVPGANKIKLNYSLSFSELKKFLNSSNCTGNNFLKFIGATGKGYFKTKLYRIFFK